LLLNLHIEKGRYIYNIHLFRLDQPGEVFIILGNYQVYRNTHQVGEELFKGRQL